MARSGLPIAHSDLQGTFRRYNELLLRWTTTETWTFERQFNVSASTLAQRNVDLVMTGVDTIAAIYVDGVSVANTTSIHL